MLLPVRLRLVLLVATLATVPRHALDLPAPDPAIRRLAHAAREADLQGRWAALGEVHDSLARLRLDAGQRPWIDYYLGYTDWRRSSLAWMGEGPAGSGALQRQCAAHLRRAVEAVPDFVEARALLVMCEATSAFTQPDSTAVILGRVSANISWLAEHAPENPRGRLLRYMLTAVSPRTPPEARDQALAAWRGLADSFPKPGSPSDPEWGGVESKAWLGMVLLGSGQYEAAARWLSAAVAERPDFWWAREIALPQARASRVPHRGE